MAEPSASLARPRLLSWWAVPLALTPTGLFAALLAVDAGRWQVLVVFVVVSTVICGPLLRRGAVTRVVVTMWFGYRLGPTTYGAFASFANDEDRQALLATGGPRSSRDNAELFLHPPAFELVDVVAARQPEA